MKPSQRNLEFRNDDAVSDLQSVEAAEHPAPILEVQSGTTGDNDIFKIQSQSTYENVQFSDQHDPYTYDVESVMDPTRSLQDADDASLANFFSRPIKISEEEWSTSVDLAYSFNPWELYFDNPRVANRLNNFNLLKADLKVKVVINGNGFQYGRMLVSYLPLYTHDTLSSNAAPIREDLVQASQQPHIFLNPTTSTGGELKLPMFFYANYMLIPSANWKEMGRLDFRTLNSLRHANGAEDVVTITTFAWAENVSMSVLTSNDQETLEPQSGEIDEANTKGMISGPATTVAKFAAYLKGVPYIAPFALATEIGAQAISSMAKIFGYSRPPITKTPEPYRPNPVSSLALTTVPDNAQKITVDDKQELTIDPRIAGLGGVDPLNIREIAKRESYLTTFQWNMGTAPDTLLWNSRVDPVTWAEGSSGDYHFPACAFAALPFQFWKGTMKFRFQIVASSFHKGRLKIVYDPNFIADTNYLGYSEYNTNYLRIVDIAEEQDFTIEVGVGQAVSYLAHAEPGIDSITTRYSTSRYISRAVGNGVLGVLVVNELTTPNSDVTSNIDINVFVSMGDDFEVAVPYDHFKKFVFKPIGGDVTLEPQMGEIVPESQNTVELDAPQQEISTIVGMPPAEHNQLNKVFFGEAISSFRTMLKRYELWNTIPKLDTPAMVVSGRFPNFPYLRGEVAGAVDAQEFPVGTPYNYVNTVLLHWIRGAFSGCRGSIRYKLVPRGRLSRSDRVEIQRSAFDRAGPAYAFNAEVMPIYVFEKEARLGIVTRGGLTNTDQPLGGYMGETLTVASVNNVLEFEVPYYSPFRFTPGKVQDFTTNQDYETSWDYRVWYGSSDTESASTTYDVFVAAGEDFQTYFFTGLPRMYYEDSPPA